jgi:hypothetical protein
MEPMPPVLAGVSDFYTREFYELCRQGGPSGRELLRKEELEVNRKIDGLTVDGDGELKGSDEGHDIGAYAANRLLVERNDGSTRPHVALLAQGAITIGLILWLGSFSRLSTYFAR